MPAILRSGCGRTFVWRPEWIPAPIMRPTQHWRLHPISRDRTTEVSRIREIDYDNRVVVAEAGVTNLGITKAAPSFVAAAATNIGPQTLVPGAASIGCP